MEKKVLLFDSMHDALHYFLENAYQDYIYLIGECHDYEVLYAGDSCNTEYCEEHNIKYTQLQEPYNMGGCIVYSPGNVLVIIKHDNTYDESATLHISEALKNYLISKGLPNVTIDNNDVLVDGYKVISSISVNRMHKKYTGTQIGINQNLDIINAICKKEMNKIPKGLSEYGLTTEEVKQWLIDNMMNI